MLVCLLRKGGGCLLRLYACSLYVSLLTYLPIENERFILGGGGVKEMTEERRRRNQQIEKGEDREKEREERRKR